MTDSPRLITDATGNHKLKVSLPGGRYQFSLDDRAVILLTDRLGYDLRDVVPDRVVPVIAAMGDAWFPNQRDIDSVIADLSLGNPLPQSEETTLRTYVTSNYVREWQVERVLAAADRVGLSDVTREELQIVKVDVDIGQFFGGSESTDSTTPSAEADNPAGSPTEADIPEPSPFPDLSDAPTAEFKSIPGIGPERATKITDAGVNSLATLANMRPADLAATDGISERTAIVAIEGVRELIGPERPTAERLAEETGVDSDVFDSALSSLAAAGIPSSEAAPTLRVAFGPTVADVDAVTGSQAYFLWEAGYRTPTDLVDATVEELAEVDQLGEKTAPQVRKSADELLAKK